MAGVSWQESVARVRTKEGTKGAVTVVLGASVWFWSEVE